ncbi:hypothetical protein I5415_03370 [Citrobacter sp. FDAARGOS_156]|uniref:hypothetical protein n=1 Tax=Citrobacter sp. FDAARGOS_156 TaxID=1702170 RepID=UPI0019006CF5|nr:hypothetical protein [Citrobacter sp. FDAARGOS_156]MBJ8887576.1 hypothetical protein [Citrobacter sp. FDAARGOS_156]
MTNAKSYLAMQAWFTTLITAGLNYLFDYFPQISFFKSVAPGAAVGISHLVILVIAYIGLPSINEIRMKKEMKAARKLIANCLANPNLAPEQAAHYNQCLIDLDNKLLKNINVRIDALTESEAKSQATE